MKDGSKKYDKIKNGDFSEIDNSVDLELEDEKLWAAIVEGCKINPNLELLLRVIDVLEKNDNKNLVVRNHWQKKLEENKLNINNYQIERESIQSALKEPNNILIDINVRDLKETFELVGIDLTDEIIKEYVVLLKKCMMI